MFKSLLKYLALTLALTVPALTLPVLAQADAASDIRQMDLYRGFAEGQFAFDTKIQDYKGGRANGTAQVASVYFRSHDAVLVDFTAPKAFDGRRILTEGGNMWLSMPSSARTIRVSADDRLMGQASNGDLLNIPLDRYSYAYGPSENVKGRDYTRIVAQLKGGSAQYSRVDFLVEPGSNKPFRSYHFGRSGKLVKVVEYRKFGNSGGRQRVTQIALIDPVKSGNVTVMDFGKYRKQSLPAALFSRDAIRGALNF